MNWNNSDLLFLPVGGSEEIGMNANLYHYDDKWILVDCGIAFPDETDLGIDVLLPDFDFIKSLGDNFIGIFLTHGHEDHIGAIPYFADDIKCPIWGTPFTIALLKKKLKEIKKEKQLTFNILDYSKDISLGKFTIRAIKTSHSIPDPVSFLISTEKGNIFHSGDWKFQNAHNLEENHNLDTYRSLGNNGILAMISDSTNSLVDGVTPSEKDAYKGLLETTKDETGVVLVTCFSSNISRIKSIFEIAFITNRSVIVVGRSLLRAIEAAREVGYIKNIPIIIKSRDFELIPRSNILVICTGSQGETASALSRISMDIDKHIKIKKGDTVIFSSRKIPGNEKAISKIQNRFIDKGVKLITDEDKNVHVSGHPSRDEIIEMYSLIKPKISIPVHGTREHIEAHAKLAMQCQVPHILKPKNGEIFLLNDNSPHVVEKKELITNVYDASEIVPINDKRFIIRRHSLWNGFVTVSVVIGDNGKLITTPQISQKGISESDKMQELLSTICLILEEFIDNHFNILQTSDIDLTEEIMKIVRKEFKSNFNKRPSIDVHINRI